MRADMAKVIVERPRYGSRARGKPKGYRRALQRLAADGGPAHEAMKARCRNSGKMLNEHLGPLRRYLDRQVGRLWDAVFAEICERIDRSNAVQDHVRDHVAHYVAVHVLLIDGVPCDGEGGWNYGRPLRTRGARRWYVCPRSGLLRRVPRISRRTPQSPRETPPRYVVVDGVLQCRIIDGAWHLVTLRPLPEPLLSRSGCRPRDVVLKRSVDAITTDEARQQYGMAVYATSVRRLARRELSQYPIPAAWRVEGHTS